MAAVEGLWEIRDSPDSERLFVNGDLITYTVLKSFRFLLLTEMVSKLL